MQLRFFSSGEKRVELAPKYAPFGNGKTDSSKEALLKHQAKAVVNGQVEFLNHVCLR